MLDLTHSAPGVVTVQADPSELTAVLAAVPAGARVVEIAPDELMVVVADQATAANLAATLASVAGRGALAVDATDGWICWTLEGGRAREAFGYLSELPLPAEGAFCGEVAHVPTRVLVRGDEELDILVPIMWEHHVRERILHDAAPVRVAIREPRRDET